MAPTHMINVEITPNPGESSLNTLRRFSRKVQSSGVVTRVRSLRFNSRNQSPFKIKQRALTLLERRARMAELVKLGKAPIKPTKK